jgi:amidase
LCPLSLTADPKTFAQPLDADVRGQRIGWLGDLQGYLPMEDGILDVCQSALGSFTDMGCRVDEARLGMPPEQIWQTCWFGDRPWWGHAWRPS